MHQHISADAFVIRRKFSSIYTYSNICNVVILYELTIGAGGGFWLRIQPSMNISNVISNFGSEFTCKRPQTHPQIMLRCVIGQPYFNQLEENEMMNEQNSMCQTVGTSGMDERNMARASREVNHSDAVLRNLFKRLLIKYPQAYSNLCKWLCFGKCNYFECYPSILCTRPRTHLNGRLLHRGHRIFCHAWHSNQFRWSIF